MVDRFGIHGSNKGYIIGNRPDVGHHAGDFHAGLAIFFEGFDGGHDGMFVVTGSHGGEAGFAANAFGQLLHFQFFHQGLWIKKIHMSRRAPLPKVDHPFGFWGMMRQAFEAGQTGGACLNGPSQKAGQSGDTKAGAPLAQKVAPSKFVDGVLKDLFHQLFPGKGLVKVVNCQTNFRPRCQGDGIHFHLFGGGPDRDDFVGGGKILGESL